MWAVQGRSRREGRGGLSRLAFLFIFPASCGRFCSAAFLWFDAATKSMQHFFFAYLMAGDRQNGVAPGFFSGRPPFLRATGFAVRR